MALKINYSASSLSKNLDRMGERLGAVVLMYAATKASEIQAKMKMNRMWVDRTGLAKTMLSVKVSQPSPTLVRITAMHGVTYGIWLELANEKKYAILGPTIREEATKIISDLGDVMSKLKV